MSCTIHCPLYQNSPRMDRLKNITWTNVDARLFCPCWGQKVNKIKVLVRKVNTNWGEARTLDLKDFVLIFPQWRTDASTQVLSMFLVRLGLENVHLSSSPEQFRKERRDDVDKILYTVS